MTRIYISKEEFNDEEDFILFDNIQNVSKMYIGPLEYDHYDDDTLKFLYDFICWQDRFPVFLTFEPYNDVKEELETAFQNKDISYSLTVESTQNKKFPVFHMMIKSADSLKYVLDEIFWMACSNQFCALSFSDNASYKPAMGKGLFGRKKPYMLPSFQMKDASTVMKIWHDAHGFNLYTSDKRYSTIESLATRLPPGTILEND